MKRVLVSFVSMVDPFTIKETYNNNTGAKNIIKSDGSLTHILRHYKNKNETIDRVYIYYSKEMSTYKNEITLAIKHFFENIEIIDLPKNDSELRTDVNKYGTFYPIISEIFEEIKKEYEYEKSCEIIINISSGTPAMQTDLSLIAITHNLPEKFKVKMIQVNSPFKQSNRQRVSYEENDLKAEFVEVDEQENKNEDRTEEEKINNTRKLILIESIKNSLNKDDYAGVYDIIKSNIEMFEDKNLLYYSQNLYYRNLGDVKNAKKDVSEDLLKELYIINDNEIDSIIERINMLNAKDKRDEINDWLLLVQTVIEDIYMRMLSKLCDFNIVNILENEKISLKKFKSMNVSNEYENISKTIESSDGRFVDAYILKNMLMSYKGKLGTGEIYTIMVLDKVRAFRNISAHSDEFITREKLNEDFKKKIEKEAKYQNISINSLALYPNNAINEVNYKLKNILKEIISEEDKPNINKALNMYTNIKEKIIENLNTEIKKNKMS